MQRQRGELVPIGDALSGMGGPVKAIRDASPQARHHFTQADQVNQLVRACEADPDLGFMARMMALCSLPRTNPGDRHQYERVNGPFRLTLSRTGRHKLPYGNLPRLILAWICTEAVRTQSRELVLGNSLAQFMRTLGIYNSGGHPQTRPRNQMKRLFSASISLAYESGNDEVSIRSPITDHSEFWWNERRPDERSLWQSKVELGEKFFQEIIRHPVPLNMNTLRALKRSPLGLDLYLWLVYGTFSLKGPKPLSWARLYQQFGADPAKAEDRRVVDNFRTKCLRELMKIKTAWPGLKYRIERGRRGEKSGALVLLPSKPSIPRLKLVQ